MSRRALQVLLILLLGLSSVCVQPEDAVHLWLGRRPAEHLRSKVHFMAVLQRPECILFPFIAQLTLPDCAKFAASGNFFKIYFSSGTFSTPNTDLDTSKIPTLANVFLSHFVCSSGEASTNSFICLRTRWNAPSPCSCPGPGSLSLQLILALPLGKDCFTGSTRSYFVVLT